MKILKKVFKKIIRVWRNKCFLSKHKLIDKNVFLRDLDNIDISEDAAIGTGSKILCTTEYNGVYLSPCVSIGKNFHATRNLTIQCANSVRIMDDVLIASDVFIIDFNHGTNAETENYLENDLDISSVVIEDGVWVGNNVLILPGVKIGRKAIVAAGSVITHDVPSYSMVAGTPAKVIKVWNSETKNWERY